MDVDALPVLVGQLDDAFQKRRRADVGRVRAEEGANPSAGGLVRRLDPLHRPIQSRPDFGLRPRAEHAPRQPGFQAALRDDFRHPIHVEVVIVEGYRAAADHLAGRQRRAPVHVIRRQGALHHPDFLVQPAIKGQVFRPAALEGHRRVAVGVEEARHGSPPAAVNHVVGFQVGGRSPDGCNLPIADHQIGVVEDRPLLVERHDFQVSNARGGHGGSWRAYRPSGLTARTRSRSPLTPTTSTSASTGTVCPPMASAFQRSPCTSTTPRGPRSAVTRPICPIRPSVPVVGWRCIARTAIIAMKKKIAPSATVCAITSGIDSLPNGSMSGSLNRMIRPAGMLATPTAVNTPCVGALISSTNIASASATNTAPSQLTGRMPSPYSASAITPIVPSTQPPGVRISIRMKIGPSANSSAMMFGCVIRIRKRSSMFIGRERTWASSVFSVCARPLTSTSNPSACCSRSSTSSAMKSTRLAARASLALTALASFTASLAISTAAAPRRSARLRAWALRYSSAFCCDVLGKSSPCGPTGLLAPTAVSGAIAAACPASTMNNPAEAASAPGGPTYTITGTSLVRIAWMMSSVTLTLPPGVSSTITTASALSRSASSSPRVR